jgi:hypothetical protein
VRAPALAYTWLAVRPLPAGEPSAQFHEYVNALPSGSIDPVALTEQVSDGQLPAAMAVGG